MKLRFIEEHPTKAQIQWGGNSDPSCLTVGEIYEGKTEVHSWHTKVFLDDFPGDQFNSVWFEVVEIEPNLKESRRPASPLRDVP